jgi:hypothetical protein
MFFRFNSEVPKLRFEEFINIEIKNNYLNHGFEILHRWHEEEKLSESS